MKVPGIDSPHSLLWREDRQRWVLKRPVEGHKNWPQKVAEPEVKTERAAIAWARGILLTPAVPPASGLTLAQASVKWLALLARRPKLRASTVHSKKTILHGSVLPFLGAKKIDAIGLPELREWLRVIRDKFAPLSCRNARTILAQLVDDAMAEGWTPQPGNPVRHPSLTAEMPVLARRSGKLVLHLPKAHVQALIDDEATPWARRIRYLLGGGTAGRDGEISAMRVRHVHLDAPIPYIEIVASVSLVLRVEGKTKTQAGHRKVPLTPGVAAGLRWWLEEGWELCYGQGAPGPDDFLLPGRTGEASRPCSAPTLRADLARLGLPTHLEGHALTFHALRRSVGSWLGEAGVAEEIIGELLGHEGKSITKTAYMADSLPRLLPVIEHIPLTWTRPRSLGGAGRVPAGAGHPLAATSLEEKTSVEVHKSRKRYGFGPGRAPSRASAGVHEQPLRQAGRRVEDRQAVSVLERESALQPGQSGPVIAGPTRSTRVIWAGGHGSPRGNSSCRPR